MGLPCDSPDNLSVLYILKLKIGPASLQTFRVANVLMSNLYTVPSEIIEQMTKMLTQGSDCSTLDNIRLCTSLLT